MNVIIVMAIANRIPLSAATFLYALLRGIFLNIEEIKNDLNT
jgi:hypothetical protein